MPAQSAAQQGLAGAALRYQRTGAYPADASAPYQAKIRQMATMAEQTLLEFTRRRRRTTLTGAGRQHAR